jgi:hypothetical protein
VRLIWWGERPREPKTRTPISRMKLVENPEGI